MYAYREWEIQDQMSAKQNGIQYNNSKTNTSASANHTWEETSYSKMKSINNNALYNLYLLNGCIFRTSFYTHCTYYFDEMCDYMTEKLFKGRWSPGDLKDYLNMLIDTTENILYPQG